MLGWYLTSVCDDIKVRKTSQAALLVLLEQGLVEKSDVEEQVWIKPFFSFLSEESWADLNTIGYSTRLQFEKSIFFNSF